MTTPPVTDPTRDTPWWRDAVIYQVYPRSWADSDGDGMGDLPGIVDRLPHLAALGVDAIWLSPFYTSPQHDGGYDVADYRDVDPLFGTLADADKLIASAHDHGLKIMVDLVPNHCSHEHPWFQQALAAPPGSPERARFLFRDGRGSGGSLPPNNWQSVFGGPAWTRTTDADGQPGQWYLHLFEARQPDFDWTHRDVHDEMVSVLRFWLDRGVDGFRIDVAHGLVKLEGLPDAAIDPDDPTPGGPMWDQPGVHEIYREWRAVVDSYGIDGDDRILCAEAWVRPADALARYVRHDEMHHAFNFEYLLTGWNAADLRATITESLTAAGAVDATQTWVLSNHDVVRHASRLGYPGGVRAEGVGPLDPQPDAVMGLRRARAATTVMLALPGAAYLYQGEELGLPEATQLPDEVRQDPTWERSGHTSTGRDGCRVPLPWESCAPSFGFGPSERAWLPQPPEFGDLAVDRQAGVPGSTLELYRTLLRLRRELGLGQGVVQWADGWPADVLAFSVDLDRRSALVVANLAADPVPLPDGARVLVSSTALVDGNLPVDAAAWLALDG